jgi:hypothetical protein
MLSNASGVPAAPAVTDLAQAAAAAGAPGPTPAGTGQPPPGPTPAGTGQPPPGVPSTGTGQPPPGVPSTQAAAMSGGRATGMDVGEEPATPEEQKEYERAMKAMAKVLYSSPKTANAIVDQVIPDDKVDSTAKVSMLFLQQLDKKINMDESVIAEMTQQATSRIMELAETRHGIEYDEQEAQVIIGTTWEGVMQVFGMDKEQHGEFVRSVGSEKLPELKQQYEAALNG